MGQISQPPPQQQDRRPGLESEMTPRPKSEDRKHHGSGKLGGYKYASVGEAEAIVNLPESAQEPMAKDIPKTAIQQRRQVLLGILTEMEGLEDKEEEVLAGEDHEDPPMG